MNTPRDLSARRRAAREAAEQLRSHAEEVLGRADRAVARSARVAASDELAHLCVEVAGLRVALESQAVVEQAKGLLAASTGVDPDAAFDLLLEQAEWENVRIVDVAQRLVGRAVRPRPAEDQDAR